MTVKMNSLTAAIVSEDAAAQLEATYGGAGKTLIVNFAVPTINGGFLVELVVEMLVAGYKGVNVYICLFDKDGSLGSTVKETL